MLPGDSQILKNLATAIACESRLYLRYQHLARIAAVAGCDDLSQALRLAVASGIERTQCVLDFRWKVDRPTSRVALDSMRGDPQSMFERNAAQFERRYLSIAQAARRDGFDEIAEWFEMAATVERSRIALFRRMLAP